MGSVWVLKNNAGLVWERKLIIVRCAKEMMYETERRPCSGYSEGPQSIG